MAFLSAWLACLVAVLIDRAGLVACAVRAAAAGRDARRRDRQCRPDSRRALRDLLQVELLPNNLRAPSAPLPASFGPKRCSLEHPLNLRPPPVAVSIDLVSTESHHAHHRRILRFASGSAKSHLHEMTTVLGFDTATQDTAVAVTRDGAAVVEVARGADRGFRQARARHGAAASRWSGRSRKPGGGRRSTGSQWAWGPARSPAFGSGIAAARALATARGLERRRGRNPRGHRRRHARAGGGSPGAGRPGRAPRGGVRGALRRRRARSSGHRSWRRPEELASALPRRPRRRLPPATARYDFGISSRTLERASPTTAIPSTGLRRGDFAGWARPPIQPRSSGFTRST